LRCATTNPHTRFGRNNASRRDDEYLAPAPDADERAILVDVNLQVLIAAVAQIGMLATEGNQCPVPIRPGHQLRRSVTVITGADDTRTESEEVCVVAKVDALAR
jgi:hypothetical protein